MLNLSINRKESVPSVALFQNDCAVGGLKFTVLGDFLYFIEGSSIYQVNWNVSNPVKLRIYQSDYSLRHLTCNKDFIAVIEEGIGLVLIEVETLHVFCHLPDIQQHYALYDEVIYYNIGLDLHFLNMNIEYGGSGYFLTVEQPITQLIADEEMLIVQMDKSHFHDAKKLLYHLNTDEMEVVGEEVKFVGSGLSSKVVFDESTSEFYSMPAMDIVDYGDLPTKAWRNIGKVNVLVQWFYHEEEFNFGCYFKDGAFHVAHLINPIRDLVTLDTKGVPEWFAVLGPIVVYSEDGSIKWVRKLR